MTDFDAHMHTLKLRVTNPRKTIFEALSDASEPLSIGDIQKHCRDIDRVTLYRTLEMFTKNNIVKIIHIGWKKQYELTDLFQPHHHHFRCTTCQDISHVSDSEVEEAIDTISIRHGFTVTSHQFELEGTCRYCLTGNTNRELLNK